MDDVKVFFQKMIEEGLIQAKIGGPKNNILFCNSMSDWCIASGELSRAGYDVSSPGGYGGSSPSARANTHNKVFRSGTVCATVIEKRILVFSIPHTTYDYLDVISKKQLQT